MEAAAVRHSSAGGGHLATLTAWSSGSTATPLPSSAGTYTVTVTDANGCTDTETLPLHNLNCCCRFHSLGSNVSCNGGNDGPPQLPLRRNTWLFLQLVFWIYFSFCDGLSRRNLHGYGYRRTRDVPIRRQSPLRSLQC